MSQQGGGWGFGASPPGFGGAQSQDGTGPAPVGGSGPAPVGGGGSPPDFGGPGSPGGFGAYGPPPGAPPGDPMRPPTWGPGEAVSFAWDRIKADPGTILGALIVGGIISNATNSVSNGVQQMDPDSIAFQLMGAGLSLVNFVIAAFMMGGMTMFCLKVARGEPYEFGDIFKGGPYFLGILVANLLTGLGVVFGLLLLIVPGIFLALAWSMTVPVLVDRQLGPIEAMKESWQLTTGHKGNIFLFGLLMLGLAILGLLACCVGVLVVGPIGQIAWVYIYLRISGQRTV